MEPYSDPKPTFDPEFRAVLRNEAAELKAQCTSKDNPVDGWLYEWCCRLETMLDNEDLLQRLKDRTEAYEAVDRERVKRIMELEEQVRLLTPRVGTPEGRPYPPE